MVNQSDSGSQRPTTWNQSRELSTGQVIGVAAAIGGGAALIFQAIANRDERDTPTVELRERLHRAVDADPVQAAERRINDLIPVAGTYRDRGAKAVRSTRKDAGKRVDRATKTLDRDADQFIAALTDRERDLVKRVMRLRDHGADDLRALYRNRDKEIRQLEKKLGKRVDAWQTKALETSGEVASMANEHVKRLQERGVEAAGTVSKTLRDPNKDLSGRVQDVRDQVVSLAKSSGPDVGALITDVREQASKSLPEVSKTVADRAGDLGKQLADQANRAGKSLTDLAENASDRLPGSGDTASTAQSTLQNAGARAAAAVGPQLSKLGDRLGNASDNPAAAVADLRAAASGQVNKATAAVQDQLDRVRDQSDTLSARTQDARGKGLDLAGLVQSNVPALLNQLSDIMDGANGAASGRASTVRKRTQSLVDETEDSMQSALDRLSVAARQAAHVGDQAVAASQHLRGTSRQAAHRTADASREGMETLIWLGAAGVALYYGVLNPEQREKVARYGMKAGRAVTRLVGDLRGRDQQF